MELPSKEVEMKHEKADSNGATTKKKNYDW